MRGLIIGIIIGMLVGGGVAWAVSNRINLQTGSGQQLGTTANPLYVNAI